jgi:hypothetical protein
MSSRRCPAWEARLPYDAADRKSGQSKTRRMQQAFAAHLRHVGRMYPPERCAKVVLLIDNAPWHRGKPINEAMAHNPHLEFKRLPSYSSGRVAAFEEDDGSATAGRRSGSRGPGTAVCSGAPFRERSGVTFIATIPTTGMMPRWPELDRLEREHPRVVVVMLRWLAAAHALPQAEGPASAAAVSAAIRSLT